ncbi:MAG TPA: ABC transporter permease [Nocardioidaceae bacterium]|jgi:ABC-2 type transport system permease protein|nr:ABC transporter permease [Nocardioidaceae bacterium]
MSRPRSPALSLAVAMAKGFWRDRAAVFFALIFPLMFLLLFGTLFSDGGASRSSVLAVGDVPLLDRVPPAASEGIVDSVDITRSDDLATALDEVQRGDADAAVVQHGDAVTLYYSLADPVLASTVRGTFEAIVSSANVGASGQPPQFVLQAAAVEDEALSPVQYLTPGLLGWAIASGATFGAATSLLQWRTTGLLRRLRLAPVTAASVVTSRVGVSLGIALFQTAVFLATGMLVFGLELTGWWWLALPLLVAGTLAFLSLGLLAGAVARTQEAAVAIANMVVLPMAFLSGSFFPLDGAPDWIRTASQVLPLRHLNDGMLDVMVRGQGPAAVVMPMVILLGFATVVTGVAARLFRWDA